MTREEHEKRVEQLRQEFAEAFSECFDCSILDFAPGWYEIIEARFAPVSSLLVTVFEFGR